MYRSPTLSSASANGPVPIMLSESGGLNEGCRIAVARTSEAAENPHLPIRRRERKVQGFKFQASAQRFLTTHAAMYNTLYTQRHLISRPFLRQLRGDAAAVWATATAAA